MGRSVNPGTPAVLLRSSSLIRPASAWVSPSFRRSEVVASRVPIWYVSVPDELRTSRTMLLTSRLTLTPTSLSRNTLGSTSSFRPTSR